MSKSTYGARRAGLASLATLSLVTVAAVAGAGSASAVSDFKFQRIGGADRYETSTLVDDEFRDTGADVILANGEPGNYADALAANTLAGEKNVPVLLTRKDKTPASVLQQLKDDGVKNIWVVGGTSVVSDAQVAALTSAGYSVTRVAGADRFATNREIIKMNGAATGATGLVATGFNFPDALAAGPFSFQGHPLALSTKDSIEDSTVQALKDAGVTKVLIFGGNTAVSPAVEAKLKAAGIDTAARFAGADRAQTSTLAAEYALKNLGFTDTHVGVASGYVKGYGADALAGGPLEGKEKSPMLVTRDVNVPGASVLDYLKNHASTLKTGHLYGGTAAISAAAQDQMEKAAQTAPASATSRPELVSASITDTNTAGELGADGTTVRFTFDEEIANASTGTPPVANLFHVYNTAGLFDTGSGTPSVSGNTVTVFFSGTDTDAKAAALTLGTVEFNAVEDPSGSESPEGDAALNSSTSGGSTALPAGITNAPDLTSIGGFASALGGTATDVEFVFDEAADAATPATTTAFHLIPIAEGSPTAVVNSTSVVGGNGTTKLIVRFPGNLAKADYARGTDDAAAVSEHADNDGNGTADVNVAQAADISNGGNSGDPDLVSVTLIASDSTKDQALFTFDENIDPAVDVVETGFHLYYVNTAKPLANGGGTAAVNGSDPRQVLVDFAPGAITGAVGGQVDASAVTANDAASNPNQFDEVGVANTGSTSGQTAGRTDGPDLTKVSLKPRTNGFGQTVGTDVTYTFDEAVTNTADEAKFFIYLADGTRDSADAGRCSVTPNGTTTTTDDTSLTCEFTGPVGPPANLGQGTQAVLGTVAAGAVTADDGGISNPEGAERVS